MCKPSAGETIERNKIMVISSQQEQDIEDRMMDDEDNNGDDSSPNNTTVNLSEEVSDPSPAFSSANTTAIDATMTGNSSSITVENDRKQKFDTNKDKDKDKNEESSVDSIREYDVLMGRGSGPNRHSGNIHFRAIVGETFDDFLSKQGSSRTMIRGNETDMLRIDPSTKNRLAQAVLDKITLEKKGRFLQKLNKKELIEATEKGAYSKLIKAKAVSIMDATLTSSVIPPATNVNKDCGDGNAASQSDSVQEKVGTTAVVYYKIIPEKQILAKIKQTFRFLRDQNETSNAEKHRQRIRRVAAGVPRWQQSFPSNPLGGVRSVPTGLSNASTMAATYALMGRIGSNPGMNNPLNSVNVNPSPLPDKLNFTNIRNVHGSNNRNLWAAARNLNNIGVPPTSSMTMSPFKAINHAIPPDGGMNYSAMASRLLCDLPQPKRVLSTNGQVQPSLLQGSELATVVSQLDKSSNGNKNTSSMDSSTKRLLEELTLSRLVNLQKQREETINAYLAMERSSGGTQGPAGRTSTVSRIERVGVSPSTVPSQQLQRLFNLNTAASNPSPVPPIANTSALGGLATSASEPLSLLFQLNNNTNGRNNNAANRSPGNHPLRSFSSTF